VTRSLVDELEFHRGAVALLAKEGTSIFTHGVVNASGVLLNTSCGCRSSSNRCIHLKRLTKAYEQLCQSKNGETPDSSFRSSCWFKIIAAIGEDRGIPLGSVELELHGDQETPGLEEMAGDIVPGLPPGEIQVSTAAGVPLATYLSDQPDRQRFWGRMVETPGVEACSRADLLAKLGSLTATDSESMMLAHGHRTFRQALEESFWFRLAYHCFREHAGRDTRFEPAVDQATGQVSVTVSVAGNKPFLQVWVPREAVAQLATAMKALPGQQRLPSHTEVLKQLIRLTFDSETGNLVLERVIRAPVSDCDGGNAEYQLIPCESLSRFWYGKRVFLPQLGRLAELTPPGRIAATLGKAHQRLVERSAIPEFLERHSIDLASDADGHTGEAVGMVLLDAFDHLQIDPHALEREWCWMSLHYGSGKVDISLTEFLQLRKQGERFVETSRGWLDTRAPAFVPLHTTAELHSNDQQPDDRGIKLTRMELLCLCTAGFDTVRVIGDDDNSQAIRNLLQLRPAEPLQALKGMSSTLRGYQTNGVRWLLFLVDNGFGGLLCDDMGLGKTHQVLGLLLALREQRQVRGPFLVVCPATVLSHWERIIRDHAPGLSVNLYYEPGRDLEAVTDGIDILLTSYGILRKDRELLAQLKPAVAVFDEAQFVKNPQTAVHQAARAINTPSKIALTGTPIENSLSDLKALFDLTLPGYLGGDASFTDRFVKPIETGHDQERRQSLHRLIDPFTLRRLKSSVLDELPAKIEDIRTCTLSDSQVKLYRDAVSSRRGALLQALRSQDTPIPYMHIFALLGLLKQICDHPALVAGTPEQFEEHESGKWDLFKELLRECLESDQKIVVYSQYLGMIRIIELYLEQLGFGFVKLTGASRKRGEIVDRFNTDPNCRVFVGSLLAGGIGIDLVAASVVFHYDRWWNAAREDQATDRVHRIGQTRGVHVFKLVTAGTLEEKVAALIAKKRALMESVVKEDDKVAFKTFSRQELMKLLELPG